MRPSGRRDQVTLATKCGLVVDDLETEKMHRDGSAQHIQKAVRVSLDRLETEVIDLYYLHRVDERVLTGALNASTTFERSDLRSQLPRFTAAARAQNEPIVDLVRAVAASHQAAPAQVALAWVLAQGEHVIPIPGTRY